MTENWDFYFCTIDQKAASMFVDLGAVDSLPMATHSTMACLHLDMLSPRDDGLSSNEEYDQLSAIEDTLKELCENAGAVYVGRCTSDGRRHFYYYTDDAALWQARVDDCLRAYPTYRYQITSHEDAAWSTYRTFLYPGAADRQSIENRRVCFALERAGDTLDVSREIDHWAEFPDAPARDAFVAGARTLGFAVRNTTTDDAGATFWAQVYRHDIPAMADIDQVIQPMYELAVACNGTYDGWESVVVRAEPDASASPKEETGLAARFMRAGRKLLGMR